MAGSKNSKGTKMFDKIVAKWVSKNKTYWVTITKSVVNREVFFDYESKNGFGYLGGTATGMTENDAITIVQKMVNNGRFKPDKSKQVLTRVR